MTLSNTIMNPAAPDFTDQSGLKDQPSCRRVKVEFLEGESEDAGESHMDAIRILAAADAILAQGELLLNSIAESGYTEKVATAFNASIGGHYRHCLDHFTSILRSLGGVVDYDHRERDRRIESEPDFALGLTRNMRNQLTSMPPSALSRPLSSRCEVSYEHGNAPLTQSTLGRELVYAIAHAIHHYALISIMARLLNARLPEHFGVAPSTVSHLQAIANSATT